MIFGPYSCYYNNIYYLSYIHVGNTPIERLRFQFTKLRREQVTKLTKRIIDWRVLFSTRAILAKASQAIYLQHTLAFSALFMHMFNTGPFVA